MASCWRQRNADMLKRLSAGPARKSVTLVIIAITETLTGVVVSCRAKNCALNTAHQKKGRDIEGISDQRLPQS